MLLYHGSPVVVKTPQYGFGRTYNDYGQGFYCTEHANLAREWAVGPHKDGFVNSYQFDTKDLRLLDLNDAQYCTLHWLALLLQNRSFELDAPLAREAKNYVLENFSINIQPFDYIKGYRADDSYFAFSEMFLSGQISYQQLQRAMHLGKLGQQIVLKSPLAFQRITFLGAEQACAQEWYPRRQYRDVKARNDFQKQQPCASKTDLYILDIMRQEMRPGHASL